MKGIIVLDGPDGAGKTYLAEYFRKKYSARYLHLTYRWKNKMFDYHTAAIDLAGKLSKDQLVVIDRWWPSELCYENAYRHGSKWPLAWRMMQRVLLKYAGIYVMCLPEDTRKHLQEFEALQASGREMYKDVLPVLIEYHKLWDKMKGWPNVVKYDRFTDGQDLVDFSKRVRSVLDPLLADQPEVIRDPRNRNVLGHLGLAKYIFVGDQTNPRKSDKTWWPFYDYAASSLHLTQLLDDLGFQEHEAMWTNANGTPEMANYLLDNFDLRPICLGTEAYLHVTQRRADMFHKRNRPLCFYHPAFDKRFPLGHKYHELREQLGSVLHGVTDQGIIYRDNVCVNCGESILKEDQRHGYAEKRGVLLPRGSNMG